MKEWQRAVGLVLLLLVAIGFIVWMRHNYSTNFLQSLH